MEFTDITCPVCGLACDDLRVGVDRDGATVHEPACPTAAQYFSAAWPQHAEQLLPSIGGESSDFDQAVKRAAELLAAADSPVISGWIPDVEGGRAALALADRFGACVDHRDSDALFRNLRVVQDCGWFTTTLSEVRNRADLVVVVGTDVFDRFPRLAERVLGPDGLFISGRRKLVLIGSWTSDSLPGELAGCDVRVIPLPLESVAEAAGLLRMLCRGEMPANSTSLPIDQLSQLASELSKSGYAVIAWSSADFAFPHAELAVESLSELTRDLNQTTRCGGLPLSGGSSGMNASQVCTWQAGFPLRTSFACGYPEHDTYRYDTARMLRERETDLLAWIATLLPEPVPDAACPTIVIGHPATQLAAPPAVFLPAAIPGIDHASHCFRTDGVVALPLRQLSEPRWPTVRQIVNRILEAAAC